MARLAYRRVRTRGKRKADADVHTAGAMLEALPGIDWYDDGTGRRTRYYRMGTGQ
jgi:hypothetical protein